MNKTEKLKQQATQSLTIFPSLIAFGIFLNIITSQKISWVFWIDIPGLITERVFGTDIFRLHSSYILSGIFAIVFWLGATMLFNWFNDKYLTKNSKNGEIPKDSRKF